MSNKKRVLMAEDDPFIGKILQASLEEGGYEVDKVTDGAQAIEKVKEGEYSIILLDLIMPVKDGFEVLKDLKEMKNKTPVLVFTNLAQEEDKKEVLSLGAKGYYVKSNMAISKLLDILKKNVK